MVSIALALCQPAASLVVIHSVGLQSSVIAFPLFLLPAPLLELGLPVVLAELGVVGKTAWYSASAN